MQHKYCSSTLLKEIIMTYDMSKTQNAVFDGMNKVLAFQRTAVEAYFDGASKAVTQMAEFTKNVTDTFSKVGQK
jgi:hypothetical protein